eukprot:2912247-Alexandrium_andersonii.AAC.1
MGRTVRPFDEARAAATSSWAMASAHKWWSISQPWCMQICSLINCVRHFAEGLSTGLDGDRVRITNASG